MASERPSRSELKQAMKLLRADLPTKIDTLDAVSVLSSWRALHAVPLATLGSFVRRNTKKEDLVAQRMKRMPSIVGKLKRFPTMNIWRMQDIAGVRIITNTIGEVYNLQKKVSKGTNSLTCQTSFKDYLKNPKSDGYRGIHLVFKYESSDHPDNNGVLLELQIRTRLQHAWAMAVEALGFIEDTAFKSGEGDETRKEFFRVASALFALEEKTAPPEMCAGMTREELIDRLSHLNDTLKAVERMEAVATLQENIETLKSDCNLILVLSNEKDKATVNMIYFDKDAVDLANTSYSALEKEFIEKPSSNVVLIYSDDVKKIRDEFPSYFLDTKFFVQRVKKYLAN